MTGYYLIYGKHPLCLLSPLLVSTHWPTVVFRNISVAYRLFPVIDIFSFNLQRAGLLFEIGNNLSLMVLCCCYCFDFCQTDPASSKRRRVQSSAFSYSSALLCSGIQKGWAFSDIQTYKFSFPSLLPLYLPFWIPAGTKTKSAERPQERLPSLGFLDPWKWEALVIHKPRTHRFSSLNPTKPRDTCTFLHQDYSVLIRVDLSLQDHSDPHLNWFEV